MEQIFCTAWFLCLHVNVVVYIIRNFGNFIIDYEMERMNSNQSQSSHFNKVL